jgi:heme-degrading monooxygenase HmoA
MVFTVLFEVQPQNHDAYLSAAGSLRPLLSTVPGFLSNTRYASLTRGNTILSVSDWATEKALVRWRTAEKHHQVQERGRGGILENYRIRVGEVLDGEEEGERGDDMTEVGEGKAMLMLRARLGAEWVKERKERPGDVVEALGIGGHMAGREGLVSWDVFEAILESGDVVLLETWRDLEAAWKAARELKSKGLDVCRIKIVREYGMFDRREAPQYYPDVEGRETVHGI